MEIKSILIGRGQGRTGVTGLISYRSNENILELDRSSDFETW